MLRCIDLYVNSFVLILPWDEFTILCTVLCIPSFPVLLMKITGKSRHVALLILKCGVARIIFLKRQAKKKKRERKVHLLMIMKILIRKSGMGTVVKKFNLYVAVSFLSLQLFYMRLGKWEGQINLYSLFYI